MTVVSDAGVIVSYYPDSGLAARLGEIAAAVGKVILVDNTPGGSDIAGQAAAHSDAILIRNGENKGIAKALNQGISAAITAGAKRVFLFDQDSEPDRSLFAGLHDAMTQLQAQGNKVALVGPAYFDTRLQRKVPFIRFRGLRIERILSDASGYTQADYLITSGSCLNLELWNEIGAMDETLFIDFVDIEWGLRAGSMGCGIFGVSELLMQHCLGDAPVSVLAWRFPLHSPLRHYYFFRNALLLIRRSYIPLNWKIIELCKIPLRFFVYSLFTKNKGQHTCMMLRGLRDGILGRSGKYRD